MTQSKSAATKRLLRDLREWKNSCHQAQCISAAPIEHDLFEWHINFTPTSGPLKDIIFHLVMRFPDNYPLHHPYVTLKNYLHHPNVFQTGVYGHSTKCGTGYWICLDMIKCSNWSAAYSVSSILMQLLSFLITTKAPQEYGEDKIITHSQSEIDKMKQASMQFQCDGCHHTFHKPFPAPFAPSLPMQISTPSKQIQMSNDDEKRDLSAVSYWAKYMHEDVENILIDFLNVADLLILDKVCRSMKKLVFGSKSVRMARFSCWYNKVDLRYSEYVRTQEKCSIEDPIAKELILGYGITPVFFTNNSSNIVFKRCFQELDSDLAKDKALEFAPLRQCQTTFDLLSKDAFAVGNIRNTPMNNQKFSHWIPMYIVHGKYHGIEALNALKQYTLQIFQRQSYHPFMSVHLICSVMSSLVVKLMEAIKANKLHHSINVLETYFHFYHLLLAVYHKYYNVLHPLIQQKCVNFIVDMNKRTKKCVPNLGNFMIWFTLCDNIPSKCIFQSLLEETFIRNQRWVIKKFGSQYEHKTAANFDINQAFLGSQVSKKLFMFQYFFMNKVCGLGVVSPIQKFAELNNSLGCINESISLRLQAYCKKLDSIKNFEQFFAEIEIDYPGTNTMKQYLRKCVDISAERRYHRPTEQRRPVSENCLNDSFDYLSLFDAVNKNEVTTVKRLLGVNEEQKMREINTCDIDIKSMNAENVNWDQLKNVNNIYKLAAKSKMTSVFDNKMTDKCGQSPLLIAASQGNAEIVQLLIENGFDINITDKNGRCAINYTTNAKIIELIQTEQNKIKSESKKTGFCASRFVEIKGLSNGFQIQKASVKQMFKRYGFASNISDDCIWLNKDHILVKVREYKINDKIENIARCFCFGHKLKAKICDRTEINTVPNGFSAPNAAVFRSRFPAPISGISNGYNANQSQNGNNYYNNVNATYNNRYARSYGHNNQNLYQPPSQSYNHYNGTNYNGYNGYNGGNRYNIRQ